MKYLLDTNIIVDHLRGKKTIDPSLLPEGLAVSIITYAELMYGAFRSDKSSENLNKIKEMLLELDIEIITLSEQIVERYGSIKVVLEKKGERLDEFDLLIASTALINNQTLVTGNVKHFRRIPSLSLI